MSARPLFSSRLTTILTMVGVAVGLGNVWRFPYMMGKYGGSAFLFVYLIFTFLFAIPALMSEMSLGRSTRQGPMGAFRKALGRTKGSLIGYILLITILVASSYYVIVIANVLYTAYFSVIHGFNTENIAVYEKGLGHGITQYLIALSMIFISLIVIYRGLHKGIEWVSKIFVPLFLVIILFLIYHTLTLEGSMNHLIQFLKPDWASLKPVNIFAALGQAFYSLSLGGTFMVIYGSYMNQDESIGSIARWTALGDVGAALLTSLFIVPAIFLFQLDMTSGPTLIFSTLPRLFIEMPAGKLVGSLFLIALSFVAFLSLVGALDVARSCLKEITWFKFNKMKTLLIIGGIELILAFPSAMDANLVGTLDLIFGSGMQVIGSGLAILAVTWGLGKSTLKLQLAYIDNQRAFNLLFLWLKWVIPLVLLFVLIGYIYSTITGL